MVYLHCINCTWKEKLLIYKKTDQGRPITLTNPPSAHVPAGATLPSGQQSKTSGLKIFASSPRLQQFKLFVDLPGPFFSCCWSVLLSVRFWQRASRSNPFSSENSSDQWCWTFWSSIAKSMSHWQRSPLQVLRGETHWPLFKINIE